MNRVAHFLGNYIASKLNYDQDRREIITYGTFVLVHNLSIIIIILLLALITGLLKEIAIVMLAYAPCAGWRRIALSKPVFCMISSVIIFPLLGFTAVVMSDYLLYLALSEICNFPANYRHYIAGCNVVCPGAPQPSFLGQACFLRG